MPTIQSGSWVVPFLLGVTTSLSVVWVLQKVSDGNSEKKQQFSTVSQDRSRPVSSSNTRSNDDGGQQLIDSPDLDHRMLRKCEAVLQWRTSRLILVVERCTNDHNYSAILRTVEALGVQSVFVIDPPSLVVDENGDVQSTSRGNQKQQQHVTRTQEEIEQRRAHHLFAQNATEWLTVVDFETSESCVAEIRRLGYELWVTDLSQEAEALPMPEPSMAPTKLLPGKVALVMGTEAVGASQYLLDQADKRVYLPLRGFADSLNLSVATALIIHHLFVMDPSLIGAMGEQERRDLRKSWFVKLTQQRLLSASQKKTRAKLLAQIKRCKTIFERTERDPNYRLNPDEKKKLVDWPEYQKELEAIDAIIDPVRVESAIKEWLDNPPDPLTDLRRADTHRVCYVGKNTKEFHKDHWKDMVATSNLSSVHGVSAREFRDKIQGGGTKGLP